MFDVSYLQMIIRSKQVAANLNPDEVQLMAEELLEAKRLLQGSPAQPVSPPVANGVTQGDVRFVNKKDE